MVLVQSSPANCSNDPARCSRSFLLLSRTLFVRGLRTELEQRCWNAPSLTLLRLPRLGTSAGSVAIPLPREPKERALTEKEDERRARKVQVLNTHHPPLFDRECSHTNTTGLLSPIPAPTP